MRGAHTVEGVALPVTGGLSVAAYRIVQEALTNVRRHAGPGAAAEVRLRRQSVPLPASAERTALIATVADMVAALGPGRLRVAVDGLTGAGKTSIGHELAVAPASRADAIIDNRDFKRPPS